MPDRQHQLDPARTLFRKLWPVDGDAFRDHLTRLDLESRRMRFAGAVSDDFIARYAETAFRLETVIYGVFIDGTLRASAELRSVLDHWPPEAEAAFAVEQDWQDLGLGTELLGRLLTVAQNRGVKTLYMICLRDNQRMQHLAGKYDGRLKVEAGEVAALLTPEGPTAASLFDELVSDTQGFVTAAFSWPNVRAA